jgi:hypothetical protein
VTFNATAIDAISGSAAVTSFPASLFLVGPTAVTCLGTDALGNTATGSFTVKVNSPVMIWRLQYFGSSDNAGESADSADPDGDGWTNLQEFISGTGPKDRSSLLKFNQVNTVGGDTQLSFATVAGKTYRIERSDSLAPDSWNVVQAHITGTGSVVTCSDANGSGLLKRFYRIVAEQP